VKGAEAVGVIVLALFAIFCGVLLGTLFGAFAGWLAGLVFDDTMRLMAEMAGIDARPWQLGAIFGFIGGFFRSQKSSDK
jgi:hypothetical protein